MNLTVSEFEKMLQSYKEMEDFNILLYETGILLVNNTKIATLSEKM